MIEKRSDMESLVRDSYILRVYRCDRDDLDKITGLVELVDNGEKRPFADFRELCKILKAVEGKDQPQIEVRGKNRLEGGALGAGSIILIEPKH
jgi:hypothetical protein